MSEMLELAKRIAERAGKNAKVAPELLYAPILWELQDDARSSAVSEQAGSANRWNDPSPEPGDCPFDECQHPEECKPICAFAPCRKQRLSKLTKPQAECADSLESLIHEYARDLRRNSSGGDDYPWEWAKATADYLEALIERARGGQYV